VHAALLKCPLERRRQPLGRLDPGTAAFHLGDDNIRVDGDAAIDGADDLLDLQATVTGDSNFGGLAPAQRDLVPERGAKGVADFRHDVRKSGFHRVRPRSSRRR
jgi:hypothetical protein